MVCVYIIYTVSKHQTKPCNFITRLRIRNMAKCNNNANKFVPYTVRSILQPAVLIACTKHRGEKNKRQRNNSACVVGIFVVVANNTCKRARNFLKHFQTRRQNNGDKRPLISSICLSYQIG